MCVNILDSVLSHNRPSSGQLHKNSLINSVQMFYVCGLNILFYYRDYLSRRPSTESQVVTKLNDCSSERLRDSIRIG